MKKTAGICIILALLFTSVGCPSGLVPMSGRVTYSDNGEPLETGTVSFTTSRFHARGTIKEDGRYTIGSYTEDDGLPPDTYQIYVSGAVRYEGEDKDGRPIAVPLIDEKFTAPATSGLTLKVDGSTKTLDFQVDRAPATK